MTIRELLEIVDGQRPGDKVDATRSVADFCRLRLGMNYLQTFSVVQSVIPSMSMAEWDALLYEADWEEG